MPTCRTIRATIQTMTSETQQHGGPGSDFVIFGDDDDPPTVFFQLDYTQSADDRALCAGCPHQSTREASEFLDYEKAKAIRDNGRKVQQPGDRVEHVGMWLKMSWDESYCTVTDLPTITRGMMHRCQHIKPPGYPAQQATQNAPQAAKTQPQAAQTGNWWD